MKFCDMLVRGIIQILYLGLIILTGILSFGELKAKKFFLVPTYLVGKLFAGPIFPGLVVTYISWKILS